MSTASDALYTQTGHRFSNPSLLSRALTHASTQAGSVPSTTAAADNYERLEFLGDRVLGLIVAQMIYDAFPLEREGALAKRLTALVQQSALVRVAEQMSLKDHVRLSDGEKKAGGLAKQTILADALEALIGALYLDGGLPAAQGFITKFWAPLVSGQQQPPEDPKTLLQEWVQAKAAPLPVYRIVAQSGSAHNPVFTIGVTITGQNEITATASSKRAAEKEAALKMLQQVGALP